MLRVAHKIYFANGKLPTLQLQDKVTENLRPQSKLGP